MVAQSSILLILALSAVAINGLPHHDRGAMVRPLIEFGPGKPTPGNPPPANPSPPAGSGATSALGSLKYEDFIAILMCTKAENSLPKVPLNAPAVAPDAPAAAPDAPAAATPDPLIDLETYKKCVDNVIAAAAVSQADPFAFAPGVTEDGSTGQIVDFKPAP